MWWLLNHDYEKSLGVTLMLEEDMTGAIATGKFNLEKQLSRDVFSDYLFFAENDRTLQHSVRVVPVKYVIENQDEFKSFGKHSLKLVENHLPTNVKKELLILYNEL
jgi:hypothetical protein